MTHDVCIGHDSGVRVLLTTTTPEAAHDIREAIERARLAGSLYQEDGQATVVAGNRDGAAVEEIVAPAPELDAPEAETPQKKVKSAKS